MLVFGPLTAVQLYIYRDSNEFFALKISFNFFAVEATTAVVVVVVMDWADAQLLQRPLRHVLLLRRPIWWNHLQLAAPDRGSTEGIVGDWVAWAARTFVGSVPADPPCWGCMEVRHDDGRLRPTRVSPCRAAHCTA